MCCCALQNKRGEVAALSTTAEELGKSGDAASLSMVERVKAFRAQWDELHASVQQRVKLAQTYCAFHKKAQQVTNQNFCHYNW